MGKLERLWKVAKLKAWGLDVALGGTFLG